MTKSDPVALATIEAIDNLLQLLRDAKEYLEADRALAALGTLQPLTITPTISKPPSA